MNVNTSRNQVTIPWGPGANVAQERGTTTELRVNDNGTLSFTETEPPKEET